MFTKGTNFYNHIRKCYQSNYPSGVAQALGAFDFGALPQSNGHKTVGFKSYAVKDASTDDESSEDGGIEGNAMYDDDYSDEDQNHDASQGLEAPDEGYNSSRLEMPSPAISANRSHTRMTMYPVGEKITSFNCTRDLVEAIRDALEGISLQY